MCCKLVCLGLLLADVGWLFMVVVVSCARLCLLLVICLVCGIDGCLGCLNLLV